MNNEAYAEWLVKRKTPAYTYALKAVMIFLCLIGAFLALTTVWGILVLAAICLLYTSLLKRKALEPDPN